MIGFSLVPLRLEPSESASLGDSYHVRRVRLNLMTLWAELLPKLTLFWHPACILLTKEPNRLQYIKQPQDLLKGNLYEFVDRG